jgi:hypothetical protein
VCFGCVCVRLWLKNYPPRDLDYYMREDPVLTRLVLLVQALGLWALLLPVLYWWFACTRRSPPPLSLALLFTAGVTFLYALGTYQAFAMAFGPIRR